MTVRSQARIAALLMAGSVLASSLPALADASGDAPLEEQFRDPPNSARPRVWWHWMNGNVSKDGIAKDFAWMKRVGIGGVQNFDANLNTPQIVDRRLVYMTPEWKDAFRFAAQEADRLGLELAIAASPGWSETGGPWVPPEDGLKKLVWSETEVAGGRPYAGKLAAPPSVTGPFQSFAKSAGIGSLLSGDKAPPTPTFYKDIAVLAYPVAKVAALAEPAFTDSAGKSLDGAALVDANLNSGIALDKPADGPATIVIAYPSPQTVRSATLFAPGAAALFVGSSYEPELQSSDDGRSWRTVAGIAAKQVPTTISFAPVTAKLFRVVFNPARSSSLAALSTTAPGVDLAGLGAVMGGAAAMRSKPLQVSELRLSGEERIDRFEAKAGFEIEPDYYDLSKSAGSSKGIDPARVIDVTAHLAGDGTLNWTPPSGRWKVLRLGYSLLGTTNHPAPPEATGLEVDKFDGAAVRRYLEHYIGMYRDAAGADLLGKRGVQAMLTDSIEVGAANWTPQMVSQFRRLRGYDPTPWLPALTGAIVGSQQDSDRFLYDYRRTLADLMASEHYGTVAAVAHENGLKVYGEALESGRPSLGDDMAMRRYADVPMSAMWTHSREAGPNPSHVADVKGAASVAHIYGQNLVAAESMTSSLSYWDHGPAYLKRIIDLEFVTGVNRPVIHTSVHQPVDGKVPGLSLFIFGQYFNRHEAWAELARPWVDYIARNALLLQQGRNVADVGYFYGEEAPLTALYERHAVADAPRSYAYDFINADALTGALANADNDLVTPGGARYRVLYLGGTSRRMTLATLRRLAALVEGGATLVGARPESDPGMRGDAAEYTAISSRLWAGGEVTQVGKGRVIASNDVEAALASIGVSPDFRFSGGSSDSEIPFVHRKLADGESYFLVNRRDHAETIEARFRITGMVPKLWRAETGRAEALRYRVENGETVVPLELVAGDAVHIVFRPGNAAASTDSLAVTNGFSSAMALDGPWTVSFQEGRGAPAEASMEKLAPLDESKEPGIRYFSGIATYRTTFDSPRGWKSGQPLTLDLGEAREVAEVLINGKSAGFAWHAPYRIDVGSLMRRGRNSLEVRVANLWVNRLIGDAQPGASKLTWTALPTYRADAPLRRSGLIGPVRLLPEE